MSLGSPKMPQRLSLSSSSSWSDSSAEEAELRCLDNDTGALRGQFDEFQKEELDPKKDARVLLLLSRDESASGANLTTANHAIFVHPLLTNSQYEYEASETQAIGRIRRYGQTRLVKVWRFLVKDSIDAEVFKQRTDAMTTAA